MSVKTERFTLENLRTAPVEVWLEPLGLVFDVPVGGRIDITCSGPEMDEELEIDEHSDGHVALFPWPGAGFTVVLNGEKVHEDSDLRPFPLPEGATLRQMFDALFGSFEDRRQMRPKPN